MFRLLLIPIIVLVCISDLLAFDYGRIQPQVQYLFRENTISNISGHNLKKLHFKVTPAGEQDARVFAEQLQRLLKWGIDITVDSQLKRHGEYFFLAELKTSTAKPLSLKKSGHNNGYMLDVHENGIRLIGDDCDGFYYGLQTILQICLQAAESGDRIPSVTIIDWPSLPQRAIKIDLSGLTSDSKIDEAPFAVLGSLKYNKVILYFHQAFPGEKFPFKRCRPNPLTEQQAAQIKEICRRHHLRISLAFQFGSHMNWFLLSEPAYKDLYEQKQPFKPSFANSNWCPLNPRLWDLVDDMLKRQLSVFEPEYVLIGHDELDYGNIKTCPRCLKSPLSKEGLVAYSIKRCHGVIKQYSKANTLVWYDQLLSEELQSLSGQTVSPLRGPEILKQLPKEIGIVVWHYKGSNVTPPIIDYFRQAGHVVWLSSFAGDGLKNNPQYALLYGTQGGILTLWYTVTNWLTPSGISRMAMNSVVLNSNWNWKATAPSDSVDLKDTVHVFKLLYEGTKFAGSFSRFMPLDISNTTGVAANQDLKKHRTLETLLETVGTGIVWTPTNKVPFHIQQKRIVLAGSPRDKAVLPEVVTIPVNQKVRALHFLHACNRPQESMDGVTMLTRMPKIGEYRLIPSNPEDKVIKIPLRYRWEITDWSNRYSAWLSPTVKRGDYAPKITYQLTSLSWNAPHNKAIRIREIQCRTDLCNGMNPMVFGITAEREEKHSSESRFSKIMWEDLFQYSSNEQLQKTWNFNQTPQLVTGNFPFHGNAMSLHLSPSSRRVDAGWDKPAFDLSEATAISFDVSLDFRDEGTLISYVYLQNPEKGYYYMAGIPLSREKDGWQRIVIPLKAFSAMNTIPKGYGMNSITRLKFSLFYKTNETGSIRIANIKIGKYEGSEILIPTK